MTLGGDVSFEARPSYALLLDAVVSCFDFEVSERVSFLDDRCTFFYLRNDGFERLELEKITSFSCYLDPDPSARSHKFGSGSNSHENFFTFFIISLFGSGPNIRNLKFELIFENNLDPIQT